MLAPTTIINDIYIKISWTTPFSNYLPITSYIVLFKINNGTYVEQKGLCDGSDSTSMTLNFCTVPMT